MISLFTGVHDQIRRFICLAIRIISHYVTHIVTGHKPIQKNDSQLSLVSDRYTRILKKKHGIFFVGVYKKDGPCKMFNIAKTGPMTKLSSNTMLKIDKDGCTIDLVWPDDGYVQAKIRSNGNQTTHNGMYQINWI